MFWKKKNKFSSHNISPNEVFLDSENIPNFDFYQFEGRIEKPISLKVFLFLGLVLLFLGFVLLGRAGYLQIAKGQDFSEYSQNNRLRLVSVAPERGLIRDRNGEILVWNDPAFYLVLDKEVFVNRDFVPSLEEFFIFIGKDNPREIIEKSALDGRDLIVGTYYDWEEVNKIFRQWSYLPLKIESASLRAYKQTDGLAHVLGYTSHFSAGDYQDVSGKAGVEKSYDDVLRGEKGVGMIEVDSLNKIKSRGIQKYSTPGENINLTIDYRVQEKLYDIFSTLSKERGFQGGAGVIFDVETGDVLAMVGYPEYSPLVLSRGGSNNLIQKFIEDPQKPFLNRPISGLYAPGSIVKPFMALAALNEGIINADKEIFSSGSISIPNPYSPGKESIFYDWKSHGWVDLKKAIAVSSNVYFYSIGGGHEDISGLGINKIKEYMEIFGFNGKTGINLEGEKEGFVPDVDSKGGVWRIGDTYNVSIGQGDFLVTPMQMAQSVALLTNGGYVVDPKILLDDKESKKKIEIEIPEEYFKEVMEGMREVATTGTAKVLSSLPVEVAAKTGTAELGYDKQFVNSWVVGFWPYKKPKFAISVVLERGDATNLVGGVYVFLELINWMHENTPEYLTNYFQSL